MRLHVKEINKLKKYTNRFYVLNSFYSIKTYPDWLKNQISTRKNRMNSSSTNNDICVQIIICVAKQVIFG